MYLKIKKAFVAGGVQYRANTIVDVSPAKLEAIAHHEGCYEQLSDAKAAESIPPAEAAGPAETVNGTAARKR